MNTNTNYQEVIKIEHTLSEKTIDILIGKVSQEIEYLRDVFDNIITRDFLKNHPEIFPQKWIILNDDLLQYLSKKLSSIGYRFDQKFLRYNQLICFWSLPDHRDHKLWIPIHTLFIPFSFPNNQKPTFTHIEMEGGLDLESGNILSFNHNKIHSLKMDTDVNEPLWYGLILYVEKIPEKNITKQ